MNYRLLALSVALSLLPACKKEAPTPLPPTQPDNAIQAGEQSSTLPPFALLLSFAQFYKNDSGKMQPGPAKAVLLHRDGKKWRQETIISEDSLVIHKAYCHKDSSGRAGIITIGASNALLKYWQRDGNGQLAAQTWYQGTFGGKWDRLRDIEEGDLDGDGQNEQIIVTHDQGVILLGHLDGNGGWQYSEIMRRPDTFIHEVEIGDLNGDGKPEFYATPSDPNKVGISQDGQVISGHYNSVTKKYDLHTMMEFSGRHAKEILVFDFDKDGRDELYVSLEAQLEKGTKKVLAPLEILQITLDKEGQPQHRTIAVLEGRQARVLTPAYLEGRDKTAKLLITTLNGGIFLLTPQATGVWPAQQVDRESRGYEHAAWAADSDGDGRDELFVAADQLATVSQYVLENKRFNKRVILNLDKTDIVWNIVSCSGDDVP